MLDRLQDVLLKWLAAGVYARNLFAHVDAFGVPSRLFFAALHSFARLTVCGTRVHEASLESHGFSVDSGGVLLFL